MSFKQFDCKDLFSTLCCEDREEEKFCFMRNDPRSKNWEVLRVEVHSCCKHSHEVKRLPIEFYLEHHVPYSSPNVPMFANKKALSNVSQKTEPTKVDFFDISFI